MLVAVVATMLFMATAGKGRRQREAYERFLVHAPLVTEALERFASDHDGAFPPDAMFTNSPQGLDDRYIHWDSGWKIDYEVRDNGGGGQFVCLEFGGPFNERQYFGLCNVPEYRRKYGRGQPIPGQTNRIWLVREAATILPAAPPPPPPPPPEPGREGR